MRVTAQQMRVMCEVAETAGREVMAVYGTDIRSTAKADRSPLTEADLRADAAIRDGLERAFAGVFILSEESSSGGAKDSETFFLVDPLDGTKEFLNCNGEFTVNIALVHRNLLVAGVVLAPALGELFYAARGLGAFMRTAAGTKELSVAKWDDAWPLRVIGSRSHGGEALSAWLGGLTREHRFVAAGSSLKFCRIAQGQADIYPRFGPTSQWDTAAAQCVLEVAGGAVLDLTGAPLCYGLDRPLLNPDFLALADKRLLALIR